jgi:hypothetical protein
MAVKNIFDPHFTECNWYRRPDDQKILILLGGADVMDFRYWNEQLNNTLKIVSDDELVRNYNFKRKELQEILATLNNDIIPRQINIPTKQSKNQLMETK